LKIVYFFTNCLNFFDLNRLWQLFFLIYTVSERVFFSKTCFFEPFFSVPFCKDGLKLGFSKKKKVQFQAFLDVAQFSQKSGKIKLFFQCTLGDLTQKLFKNVKIPKIWTKFRSNLLLCVPKFRKFDLFSSTSTKIDKIRLFSRVFEQKMIKIPKIGPNLTQLFAKLTKTYGFTQEKKRKLTKLGFF